MLKQRQPFFLLAVLSFFLIFSQGVAANQFISDIKLLNYTDSYGNVSLRHSRSITLPNPLHVKGNLNLENSDINYLPGVVRVDGNLNLAYS
ncbi:MAG: hypothetical protein WCF45_14055, partial [Photobacterium halotolerans]